VSASVPIYVAVDGLRYLVLDGTMHRGGMVATNAPAAWATFRLFRQEEGQHRLYYFRAGESRAPDPALLEQQLQRAEWLPSKKYEPADQDLR
jgi:hypothetical protein